MLKGFPVSNHINPSKFAATSIAAHKNEINIALVGFASKGPINTNTVVKDSRQLRKMFGIPHPDQSSSVLLYAAEQCLLVDAEVLIYRAAENAKVASIPIPGEGNVVKTHSPWPEPYVFHTNQFFRWKLNGVMSNKILVVLATEKEGISTIQLVDELNDQLTPKDGIQFYVYEEKYLAVRTTLITKNELELVSIQDAMYGPWGVTGFGTQMSPAEKIGASGLYNLEFYDNLILEIVVSGSDNITIDGIVQTIKLKGLEGKTNNINDIVDYINNVELPLLPGGWRAFATGNALGFRTKHAGKDASIIIKSGRVSKIFGLDNNPAFGKSPKDEAIFSGSKRHSDDTSLTIYADSPGVDGNNTRVVITNDCDINTFTIDVFNDGIQVESWGQLTKDKNSRFYVGSFVNLVSEWIRVIDNSSVSPKNGSYLLGDERVVGAVKGSDGIPADITKQDKLLADGMDSLTGVDLIAVPGHSSDVIIKALLNMGGCMPIIDPPMGLSATDTLEWTKPYKSDFAAVFWPWVQIRDSYNRRNVWVPPSGSVIAALVRADTPWHSVTAQSRGILPGISDVFNRPTYEERIQLNGSCVNPIMQYAGTDSFAVNSQKTLRGGNINTRRTLLYVEKRIRKAIDKLTGCDLSKNEYNEKISQVCEYVLRQVKNGCGIHDYTIDLNKYVARIGIQPREASGVYNIDFLLHRVDENYKGDK